MASKSIDNAFTAKSLRDAATDPTYAGALSFMRRRYTKDLIGADAVVLGIPFDAAAHGAAFVELPVHEGKRNNVREPHLESGEQDGGAV